MAVIGISAIFVEAADGHIEVVLLIFKFLVVIRISSGAVADFILACPFYKDVDILVLVYGNWLLSEVPYVN